MKREKVTSPIMRKFRFYFVLGFMALIVQFLLTIWGYQIIAEIDSASVKLPNEQQQQHPIPNNNKNRNHDRPPDGSFNGYPLFYHDLTLDKTYHSRPYSSVRCVGENYQGNDFDWMHRSCHFRFICFNVSSREFEIYARPDDETLGSVWSHRPFMDLSASVIPPPVVGHDRNFNSGVSLASGTVRHPRYYDGDNNYNGDHLRHLQENFNWFPTVRPSPPQRYYALEQDFVLVPFHSDNLNNGEKEYSVVWDDLLPIYTLLNMFQLASPDKEALLVRNLPLGKQTQNSDEQNNLQRRMGRFRPLMMQDDRHDDKNRIHNRPSRGKTNWTSQVETIAISSSTSTIRESAQKEIQSGLICAKDGVAGLGPHGMRYMKTKNNWRIFHNQGKGSLLWSFRNYCLENLGLSGSSSVVNRGSNIRIVLSTTLFSVTSASGDTRLQNLKSLETELREFLPSEVNDRGKIIVESYGFPKNGDDVTSRAKLMMDTTVFIADCSDETVTAALFLPKGASLIMFCFTNNSSTTKDSFVRKSESTCREFEELLNNLSHVFVHWFPVSTMGTEEGKEALFDVVRHAGRL